METIPSLRSYLVGFTLSVLLTVGATLLIVAHNWSGHTFLSHLALRVAISAMAFAQFVVQLIFFLHLAHESGPRWKLGIFISTLGIVGIVVVGSVWILNHLNYDMMASPTVMEHYIQSQDGF